MIAPISIEPPIRFGEEFNKRLRRPIEIWCKHKQTPTADRALFGQASALPLYLAHKLSINSCSQLHKPHPPRRLPRYLRQLSWTSDWYPHNYNESTSKPPPFWPRNLRSLQTLPLTETYQLSMPRRLIFASCCCRRSQKGRKLLDT